MILKQQPMLMSNHKRKRKILYFSLLASCLVHGLAIYFVSRNHLDFLGSSQEKEEISKVRIGAPIDLNCKVLFNELAFSSLGKKLISSSPVLEKASLAFTPIFATVDGSSEIPLEEQGLIDSQATLPVCDVSFHFSLKDLSKTFSEIKENLKIITAPIEATYEFMKKKFMGSKEDLLLPFSSENPFMQNEDTTSQIELFQEDTSLHLNLSSCPVETKAPPEIPLDFLTSLKKLQSTALQNFFDVQVTRDHHEEGLFAITLIPKNEIEQLKKLKQNYIFVIDKSHSIDKKRFDQAKRAVLSSLLHVGKNNRFNIVTFSRDVAFLSQEWLTPSSKTLKDARNFLSEQAPSGMLSSTTLFPMLQFVRKQSFTPHELTTVVMITDGNMLSRSKNAQLLEQWTRTNPYQVSFYSCAIQGDKNLSLLNFFTSRNRGSVAIAASERAMKRQLEKIVKKVSEPIASDVSLFAKIKDDQNKIYLSPSCHRIFPLYANEPLVIIGKASQELKDFDLFVQGKNGKEWLLFKKEIAFSQAKEAEEALLSKEWALYRSHLCYERYYREKNPAFLANARSILLPFGIPVAIE